MIKYYSEQQIAVMLGFDPDAPQTWPDEVTRRLALMDRWQGREKFLREINQMMVGTA